MIDNYLRQFEKIITPKTHSLISIQSGAMTDNSSRQSFPKNNKVTYTSHIHLEDSEANTPQSNRQKIYDKEMMENNSKNISISTKDGTGFLTSSRTNTNGLQSKVSISNNRTSNISSFTSPRLNLNSVELTKNLNLIEEEGSKSKEDNNFSEVTKYNFNQDFSKLIHPSSQSSFTQFRNCNDVNCLKEIINEEKKKNMNYRQEINELNRNLEILEKKVLEQENEIEGLKSDKDLNAKYILKMEGMLNKIGLSRNNQKLNTNSLSYYKTDPGLEDSKLKPLLDELQNLKQFQIKIFELSSTYDEVNENIINTLKDIQELFTSLNESLNEKENKRLKERVSFDFKSLDKLKIYFEKIISNFDKSLSTKQDEFNYLMQEKENEIKVISAEFEKLKRNYETLMRDRITDQRKIEELGTKSSLKDIKIQELENHLKLKLDQKNVNFKGRDKYSANFDAKKKVELARKSVERSVRKMKKSFDMKDISNVRLIENINFFKGEN